MHGALRIHEAATRVAGTSAPFFSTCSLKLSQTSCAELRFVRAVLFYYSLLAECGARGQRLELRLLRFHDPTNWFVIRAPLKGTLGKLQTLFVTNRLYFALTLPPRAAHLRHHPLELAHFFHHLLHLVKTVQQCIQFRDTHAAAFGNALAPTRV